MALKGRCHRPILCLLYWITLICVIQTTNGAIVEETVSEGRPRNSVVHSFISSSGDIFSFYKPQDSVAAEALKLFHISENGVVTTAKTLTYTIGKPNRYELTVLQRPQGATEGGLAHTLRISVRDINNFPPTFAFPIYDGRVTEGSPANTLVEGLEKFYAEDRDTSGIKAYKIISGNERGYFQATTKTVGDRQFLELKTTSTPIVRDPNTPFIILTIEAQDGGNPPLFGSTKVKIAIEDSNNNAPKFEENQYSIEIQENTPLMTKIMRVKATDNDVGTNGGIYYYMNPLDEYFSIDAITGDIKVVRELDYSVKSSHSLEIYARDRGSPAQTSSKTIVVIKISSDIPGYPPTDASNQGQNTNPYFAYPTYKFSIREDFPVKAALLPVRATDNDPVGPNKRLRYTLSGSDKFIINQNSGIVTLNKEVDYETESKEYTLTVTATDQGSLSATTKLVVEIQDVDENHFAPKFNTKQESVSIPENRGNNSLVYTAAAKDSDAGSNGKVSYYLEEGSGLGYFKINPDDGKLTVAGLLDREKQSHYELVITAIDGAVFPRSSRMFLVVKITDVNDNNPYFTQPIYLARVPEKSPENTFVTVISAKDPDADAQTISYGLTDASKNFKVDPQTGVVRTARSLEGSVRKFELAVTASSGDTISGQLNATVTSKADKPPVFKNTPYQATVPENMGIVPNLMCIAAVDSNSQEVKYKIASGADNVFGLDSKSGRLYSLRSFDYEDVDRYNLRIEASSGSSKEVESTPVSITITGEQDAPQFSKSSYTLTVPEDTSVGTTLTSQMMSIIDSDTSSDQFDCSIEKVTSLQTIEHFSIVQSQGACLLVLKKKLDSYITNSFKFEVSATDRAFKHMNAKANVIVTVQDVNDHKPEFSKTSYWISVPSSTPADRKLLELKAVDRDTGTNGDVIYELGSGSESQRFKIQNGNELHSASSLSPDVRYQLLVKALDSASSPKTSSVTVYVSVYGPSESPVVFGSAKYTGSIAENAGKNTNVLKVAATKSGSASGITYELVGGHTSASGTPVFTIDSSGQVSLISALDREVTSSYKLFIRAKYTGGSVPMATDVEGIVTVTDINDNAPKFGFIGNSKVVTIENYTPTGNVIIKALAFDPDEGANGEITYDIVTSKSTNNHPFQIDSKTGDLRAAREIRYQAGSNVYAVVARAKAGSANTEFTFNIEVVNTPRPPTFAKKQYTFTVSETADPGTTVQSIKAVYSKSNAFLKYTIMDGNRDNAFCINGAGKIFVARSLDREQVPTYLLRVRVELGSSMDDTSVLINLLDINDDPPHFKMNSYTLSIEENTDKPLRPIVSAVDHDSDKNGQLSYEILQSVETASKDLFNINTKTGELSLAKKLDYEKSAKHVLFVRAQDNGSPRYSSIARITINVVDQNDEFPIFASSLYRGKVALDAAVGTSVIQVRASDLDSSSNGEIEYSLIQGNEEEGFQINNQGVISVKKPLTTVEKEKFKIRVQAADKGEVPKKGYADVEINVFLPDGPPKFVVSPVIVNVVEGVPANSRVAGVKAATSEALTYTIIGGNDDDMFTINPSTGQLDATRVLDYEEKEKYEVQIEARDTRDRSAAVTLIINVININDNKPIFPGEVDGQIDRKAIGICNPTDIDAGQVVTRLGATDKDKGDKITYELDPEGNKYFEVDPNGVLRAKEPLEGLPNPYKFRVKAKDDGKPAQENDVNVRLVFLHYRPDQDPVRVRVPEDTKVGSVIAQVPRYFPNGTIQLLLPEKANFSIRSNGDVILLTPLDYETQRFHSITVREKDSSGGTTNDVDVEITVLDVNDNRPIFLKKSLIGTVNTNSRAGAPVYQLNAEDKDGGSSGLVGYQLEAPEDNKRRKRRSLPQSPFTINPRSRQLEVAGPLGDKRYKMPVYAFDYGIPRLTSDTIKLNIDASEAGQLAPRFTKVSYHFNVSEDAGYLHIVGTVKARSISGARMDYSIISGNTGEKFRALENGNIVVNSLLNLQTHAAFFNLKVIALEQIPKGLSSIVDVRIDVIDANDHVPYFTQMLYSISTPENAGVGKLVHTVKAFDCDCVPDCNCPSTFLQYSIEPSKKDGGKFFIDKDSGQISVSSALDYENKRSHMLKVTASDTGKKVFKGICFVNVTITNINDNIPIFSQVQYDFRISEQADPNIPLAFVLATDADGDTVTYTKTGGSNLFSVDPTTGVIKLNNKITSSKTQYSMQIEARDSGGMGGGPVTVVINVDDANDHRPEFKTCPGSSKPETILENLPAGHRVFQVEAEDKDRGKNGQIQYSIVDAQSLSVFKIDKRTGEIRTITSLDRESKKSTYTTIIKAEDGTDSMLPEERLLKYCFLRIDVLDANDNRPYFAEVHYYGSVQNTAPNGTEILTVQATDNDEGSNAKVKYALTNSEGGLFAIHPSTGVLTVNGDLKKFTTKRKFLLTVSVRDVQPRAGEQPGQNTRYSTNIEVVVTPNPPPTFTQSEYTGTVREGVDTGTSVLTIKATSASGEIRYIAVNTNPKAHELFRISADTGVISTGSQIDYEAGNRYEMHFMAKETKNSLYSTCKVIITIQDVNDQRPIFELGVNTDARVLENVNPGAEVIDNVAYDKDTGNGGTVSYSLKNPSDPNFRIDQNSGAISTKVRLDREQIPKYDVIVVARDGGGLMQEATIFITVVDQNDMKPIFAPKRYTGSTPEDSPKGTSILSVYATDNDVGDNAKLKYFISGGDPQGKFTVKTKNDQGVLEVNGKLDYETVPKYTLQITATDGKFVDTATVVVTITDVNDLPPVFLQPLYKAVLQENTIADVAVTTVTASDIDGPSVTFSLGDGGKGYFTITTRRIDNTKTYEGDIKTGSTKLDREASPVKIFSVIASDGKHDTTAVVMVNLTDVNDNKPRFPSSPYIGYVQENQPAGTSVMYVQAVDDDDPFTNGNAIITYELTDSAGGKFKIDPNTGLITTLQTFDRETPPDRYKVKVRATDAGNPKLAGEIDATIIITDYNDWAPEFTEKTYRGTVSERAPPAYRVTAVSATDKDIGPNAEFEFVVVDGNFPNAFYVDPYNGTVLVSGILDYEKKNFYKMTVEVYDRGNPPMKGKEIAYVEITVTDANDNAPVFIPKEYKKKIPENLPVGEEVLKVTAIDEDSGPNGNITFAITGGNEDDIFTIEPDPKNGSIGIIKTRLPVDREAIPWHHLVVTATDPGGLQGKGDVWLNVTDVNDNGPWFVPPFYVAKIKENSGERQFVTKLSAIDPDEYVPGQSVAFTLVNGTSGNNFRLDPGSFTNDSANVYSYGVFDREAQPTWKIGVLATESNPPKNTNFTYIYVDIEDENDKEPNDGSLRIIINSYNGSFKGGVIGKPYYKDDDFDGDQNIYKLDSQSPGSYFSVNENTGDITAQKNIPLGDYKLKFAITESSATTGPRKNAVDFPKTVASNVDVLVRRIDPVAVKNSVAMQFIDMRKVGYFVGDFHDTFVSTVGSILGKSSEDVKVFSVQKAPDRIVSVNTFFAVSSGDDEYMSPLDVINALVKKEESLEDLGLKIGAIGIDECAKEKHKIGKCTNLVKASPAYTVASGDYGKVPAPASSLTIVSMDVVLKANYTVIFPPIRRCKPLSPCLNGGTCFTTVPECPGFVCKCPPGYHGPRCELTTRTFYGNSHIWLPKLAAYEMSDIEFDFITLSPDGLLLYQGPLEKDSNNGAKDFIAVPLVDGRIQVHLSLGHEPVVVKMDKGPRLDDGEWHTVHVARRHKKVEVIIDRCSTAVLVRKLDGHIVENRESCHVYGKTLGRSVYLDGFGPLQIGGVTNPDLAYPDIPYKGFRGCIRNIKDNSVMYDLKNPLKVVNAPEGCELAKPCPNCNNQGYCEPLLARNSICVCNVGYSGNNCKGRGPATFYLDNSYTQYLVKTSRRKRRELVPAPKSLLNKYYTAITLHVKVEPDASDVVVFLASNHMGTEFQRVDVKDHKLRYILRLGNRMLVLGFPQINATDNVYHTVVVRRQGNRATLQLDYKGYQLGNTRGERTLLDMGGGTLFAGGLPNVTVVRIVEAILLHDGNIISSDSTDMALGTGFGAGVSANLESLEQYFKVARDSAGFAAVADNVKGVSLKGLHVSSGEAGGQHERSKREAQAVSVLGDFGGCIAGVNVNGADLASDPSVTVRDQNVITGCPCLTNHCLHGGTCVNAMPPYCICPSGWTGPRCETIVTQPNPGTRPGSRIISPGVIAMILVVLIAVLIIVAALLIKKRPVIAPVVVTDHEEGHVHDNVRLYHEEGGGEEDNFGFDITKLMKYTYIETTIPPRHPDSRITEGDVDVPESAPLLQGAAPPPSSGPTFGMTGKPGPKMPKYMEGDDIGDFITTRVTITNREVYLAVDELHIYRYEGDDSDVDDLSEIEDGGDEDDEYEQEFEFLKQWGTKFDKLSKMYEGVDD